MDHPAENPTFTSDKWPIVVIPATETTPARWSYYIDETKVLVGYVEVKINRKGVKKLTCKCEGMWFWRRYTSGDWKLISPAYLTDIGIRATKVGQEIKQQSNA